MRLGQSGQALEELGLLFSAHQPFLRVRFLGNGGKVVPFLVGEVDDEPTGLATAAAAVLLASLVRDAEEPRPEAGLVAQRGDVADGAEEGLLDHVERGLVVAEKFAGIGVERQLIPTEERVPCGGIACPGGGHGQCFVFGLNGHRHPVECTGGRKVQPGRRFLEPRCAVVSAKHAKKRHPRVVLRPTFTWRLPSGPAPG